MARREVRRAFLAFHDFLVFIVDFAVAIDLPPPPPPLSVGGAVSAGWAWQLAAPYHGLANIFLPLLVCFRLSCRFFSHALTWSL